MIGPAGFFGGSHASAKSYVRSCIQEYRQLDNTAADRAPATDCVDVNSDQGRTQVSIKTSFREQHILERFEDALGNVTFRRYDIKFFKPIKGYEVKRSAAGEYSGKSLIRYGGSLEGFYSDVQMSKNRAAEEFHLADARLKAEFAGVPS